MKALVFAAGLGTRLRPLTDSCPKALVDVAGTPALGRVLRKLDECGVTDVVVNVHHFADMVERYLSDSKPDGMNINISTSVPVCSIPEAGCLQHADGLTVRIMNRSLFITPI